MLDALLCWFISLCIIIVLTFHDYEWCWYWSNLSECAQKTQSMTTQCMTNHRSWSACAYASWKLRLFLKVSITKADSLHTSQTNDPERSWNKLTGELLPCILEENLYQLCSHAQLVLLCSRWWSCYCFSIQVWSWEKSCLHYSMGNVLRVRWFDIT